MAEEKQQQDEMSQDEVVKTPACENCDEYKNGWKRALADYENLKNDLIKQREEARRSIKVAFAQDLLPVIDNFAQALAHMPHPERAGGELKDLQSWLQGVTFIEKQFSDVLSGLGVEKIEVGDTFDPNLHESVGEGEEMKEVRSGWKIGDHVIRPAQVIIKQEESK